MRRFVPEDDGRVVVFRCTAAALREKAGGGGAVAPVRRGVVVAFGFRVLGVSPPAYDCVEVAWLTAGGYVTERRSWVRAEHCDGMEADLQAAAAKTSAQSSTRSA